MALRFDSGPLESYGAAEATTAGITVPDASLLLSGEYARAGQNLNLTGDDDSSFVVIDYFSSDNPPSLSAPNGAMIDGETVSLLAGPQSPGQYAQAAVPPEAAVPQATQPAAIGKIGKLEGSAEREGALRAGETNR